MDLIKRKLQSVLLQKLRSKSIAEAVDVMWESGLLNMTALEKLYISTEVQRRVRAGEVKTRAISQLSQEMSCSYEKVRAAVYCK
jgi:hypothetical protein